MEATNTAFADHVIPASARPSLLLAARGFSAIFWSLAATVLLMTGTITVRPFATLRAPAYLLSVGLLGWAAVAFWRSRDLSPRWRLLARQFALAVVLQLYMVPFLGWWRTIPHPAYHMTNAALLVLGILWLILLVHLLSLEMARLMCDPVLRAEAHISLGVTPVLLGLAGSLFLLGASWVSRHTGAHTAAILGSSVFWQPPWSLLPAALPFLMALALSWETKDRCLRVLVTMQDRSERS